MRLHRQYTALLTVIIYTRLLSRPLMMPVLECFPCKKSWEHQQVYNTPHISIYGLYNTVSESFFLDTCIPGIIANFTSRATQDCIQMFWECPKHKGTSLKYPVRYYEVKWLEESSEHEQLSYAYDGRFKVTGLKPGTKVKISIQPVSACHQLGPAYNSTTHTLPIRDYDSEEETWV